MSSNIFIGTAGWSYQDWKGVVYPAKAQLDELEFLAHLFDAVEVNSSFYRPPAAHVSRSWTKRVEHNHRFLFTMKLFRGFTHLRHQLTPEDELLFKKGIEPVMEAGKLGALLLQFPYSFHNTPRNKAVLVDLFQRFGEYPLVVEIRHGSWDTPVVMESLARHGVGFCNLDQPHLSRSIQRTEYVTSKVAYLRLHGRNYVDWFRKDAGAQRYNYLYSPEELKEMVPLIRNMALKAEKVFVITNNHWRGQAVANALQLMDYLDLKAPAPPSTLIQRYPHLHDFLKHPHPDS